MPIIRVELFPGRSVETKTEIAEAFTQALEKIAGISPQATTIMFNEVSPEDWFVGAKAYSKPSSPD